jgi:glycosyltransferase involved in cell wall biosynthesis
MSDRVALVTEIPAPYRIPVFNELNALLGGRLDVYFIAASEPRRDWQSPLSAATFRHETLGGLQAAVPYRGDRQPIYLAPALWPRLRRRRPSAVIVGGWNHLECWWSLAYAKTSGARFVLWSETPLLGRVPRRPLRTTLKKTVVRAADAYVVPGPSAARYLRQLGAPAARIHTAPNAVDVAFWSERPPEAERPADPTILYSGRLVRAKGVDLAVEAFALSRLRDVGRLVVAGDGPERRQLERRAGAAVTFAGAQSPIELRRLYHSATMLVFPSRYDPWGLVVNEAACAGVAAIASDGAGATRDLLRDDENAIVVRAGDMDSLRKAFDRVATEPELPARLGAAAVRIAMTNSPAQCARGLAESIA